MLDLHNPKCLWTHTRQHTLYQCVFPSGAIPQPHTVVCSSGEEEEAVSSKAEAVHSAIMSRVNWLNIGKNTVKGISCLFSLTVLMWWYTFVC